MLASLLNPPDRLTAIGYGAAIGLGLIIGYAVLRTIIDVIRDK